MTNVVLLTSLILWCWAAQLVVASSASDAWSTRPSDPGFVYVYKLPEQFTEVPEGLPARQATHREDYDTDWQIYQHLLHSPVRTENPARAKLFYVPVIIGRQHHYSKFHDPPEGFIRHLDEAVEACNELLSGAIRWVSTELPYFNRSAGADHIVTFPNDHGRCDAVLSWKPFGHLRAIQHNGNLLASGAHSLGSSVDPFKTPDDGFYCYHPRTDIVVPPYYSDTELVSPFIERDLSVLLLFGPGAGDASILKPSPGDLRGELLEAWDEAGMSRSRTGGGDISLSRTADLCFCPPGIAQHTSRFFLSILAGCVPVTFFRGNHMPFAMRLDLDYSRFTLNIGPDEAHLAPSIVSAVLNDKARLWSMKAALAEVQAQFLWVNTTQYSVFGKLEQELALIANI